MNKENIINLYMSVKKDFEMFEDIKTTEDYFVFRNKLKYEIEVNLRNQQKEYNEESLELMLNKKIESLFNNNESLKMLHNWALCHRKVTSTKAFLRTTNARYNIKDNDHIIKATGILHNHLQEKNINKANDLFYLMKVAEINSFNNFWAYSFKPITTGYEFENIIFKQDEISWPAPLFVAALKAYGIKCEDLIEVANKFTTQSLIYIEEVTKENKKLVLVNKS